MARRSREWHELVLLLRVRRSQRRPSCGIERALFALVTRSQQASAADPIELSREGHENIGVSLTSSSTPAVSHCRNGGTVT
jgi:hypothetical protein